MKLSWSHKLFLRINSQIGKYPWLDRIMYFCGFWLIGVMAASFVVVLGFIFFQNKSWGMTNTKVFLAVTCLSYLMSYFIAMLWPHERPIKELPQVKNLFKTLGTWKSFPSDHTIAVTVFALVAMFATGSVWISMYFVVGAVLVALGRVYGGVHYPRDILGGASIATVAFCTIIFLLYTQQ